MTTAVTTLRRQTPFYHAWHARVPTKLSRTYRLVLGFAFFLVGLGTYFSLAAPIDGSFLSQGRVVAQGKNRVVEHLEGGIVREVLVREGEAVEAGDVLAHVDVANAETQLKTAQRRKDIARITLARHLAEQQDADEITFQEDLLERAEDDPQLAQVIETQTQEFEAKTEELAALEDILNARIASNTALIADLEELSAEQEARIAETEEEAAVSDDMLAKGLTTRDRNFALKRQLNADQDRLRSTLVQIAERESQIEQTREQLNRAVSQRENEVSERILTLRGEIFEQSELITYYSGVAGRSRVVAPVAGIIVDVATNTQDEVIAAGEALFEIYPEGLPLAVEARVAPQFIDSVFVGQHASMQFASRERSRSVQILNGEVAFVSRDSEQDERTGEYFYTVRIAINEDSLAEYGEVVPGNLAQVYFSLERQNFIQYLIDPLIDASDKAFVG